MGRFILQRALQAAVVIVVVVTLAFVLAQFAPGDPFWAIDDSARTGLDVDTFRAQWGYDQPVWRQYARWLANFVTGEFGWSHSQTRPVASVLGDVLPNTLLLMVPAITIGMLAGVALGTWQAANAGRIGDKLADWTTLVLISIPDFIIAVAVLSVFAVRIRLFPASGMVDPVMHDSMSAFGRVRDVAAHLVLPGTTLALVVAAVVSRYQRTAVVSVLGEGFIRTARAKGVRERDIVVRHALRNALGPVVAIGGLLLPAMFGGAVFVERIFGWPGMGLTLVDAVAGRDYALVQAIVVVGTVLVTVTAVISDLVAVRVNPRTTLDA